MNLDQYVLYESKYSSFDQDMNSSKTFIIILKVENDLIGFYVDSIVSIDHIVPHDILELSPIFQTSVAIEFIKGIINSKDRPRVMLDLGKIFIEVEKFMIQQEDLTLAK